MTIDTAEQMRISMRADCSQCFGLCCTALYIAASADFAMDKIAGQPCTHLQPDYRCGIHATLRETGFKGCTVFDCLGAGQQVSQVTFQGMGWRENPEHGELMFQVFPIMLQVYEIKAFVAEALTYPVSHSLREKLSIEFEKLEGLTRLDAERLLKLDLHSCRVPIKALLTETSISIRQQLAKATKLKLQARHYAGVDWMGKKLAGNDLSCANLRGAFLIAADLRGANLRGADCIGADLRDANISGADLSTAMFLTQMQLNAATGDMHTKLPAHLQRPSHWK
ncbi:pentapeptide repeat-containing protein [Paenibacillus septentrionalis]|uniref:Pentapeptide repeat-containing protein n=1 Tax=Paenibacillus septentrionalis TaxID=429342 RepID=A0ABW1V120_9BACL